MIPASRASRSVSWCLLDCIDDILSARAETSQVTEANKTNLCIISRCFEKNKQFQFRVLWKLAHDLPLCTVHSQAPSTYSSPSWSLQKEVVFWNENKGVSVPWIEIDWARHLDLLSGWYWSKFQYAGPMDVGHIPQAEYVTGFGIRATCPIFSLVTPDAFSGVQGLTWFSWVVSSPQFLHFHIYFHPTKLKMFVRCPFQNHIPTPTTVVFVLMIPADLRPLQGRNFHVRLKMFDDPQGLYNDVELCLPSGNQTWQAGQSTPHGVSLGKSHK